MPRPQRGDAEILREAKRRFERCQEWEATARHRAEMDVKFANADVYNGWQWDEDIKGQRRGRPCLTHNKVRQHNLQIINDARQNKTQVKVTPTGDRATYEAAQVFSGIIRRIEYQSKAVDAYSTAIYHQVERGIGYVSVVTEYVDDQSFDLEIYIKRVSNPDTIYLDPDAAEYDKADMHFAFVFEDVPRDEWEAEHGEHEAPAPAPFDYTGDSWVAKDHVRVAQYWRRTIDTDRIHLLHDGRVLKDSDIDDAQREVYEPLIAQTRDVSKPSVSWYRIEGDKITERGIWPGKYIPIVPFIGEESVIDGIMDRKGHTRSQIDAQRMYNYWASSAVEQVALQSKVPWIADAKSISSHMDYWKTANITNHAFLPYNSVDDDGNQLPPPQRAEPPNMAQAYIEGMTLARQDLLDVTGQYQAELGMPSNERSGVAIQQRQRQGDNATYHYIDNQAKGIRQVGRILLDLIPKVYDTTRTMKIMHEDGTDKDIVMAPDAPWSHMQVAQGQNGQWQQLTQGQADQQQDDDNQPDPRVIFNPNVGRYDVEADVGPSFGTQRQETANALVQIMAQTGAWQVFGDVWAANSDFPGADELADRLKRGLPQQYKPGPDPQMQAVMQQAQQFAQKAQQGAQQADAEIATPKAQVVHQQTLLQDKSNDLVIDEYKAETDRLKAIGGIDPNAMQVIIRQMVRDMLQTELPGLLAHHGDMEMALQGNIQAAAPPPEPQGNGTGNGPAAG